MQFLGARGPFRVSQSSSALDPDPRESVRWAPLEVAYLTVPPTKKAGSKEAGGPNIQHKSSTWPVDAGMAGRSDSLPGGRNVLSSSFGLLLCAPPAPCMLDLFALSMKSWLGGLGDHGPPLCYWTPLKV